MGKETDLIKAVKNNDKSKLQKLFLPEGNFKVQKADNPAGGIRLRLHHINVDCHEPVTGNTPLILAILNGSKDIAESLIFHAADVDATDSKGNTALHIAVFTDRADVAETLLKNKAQVNVENSDGNTPLHIACQSYTSSNVLLILKLLTAGADTRIRNKQGLSPLDLAAMFNRKDAVSAMMDHLPELRTDTRAIVEAAVRGHSEIVELLLEYGCDPNAIDSTKQTGALHEAVRFIRVEVTKMLLQFGARVDIMSGNVQSPEMIAKSLPCQKAEEFLTLFKEYADKKPRVAKYLVGTNDHREKILRQKDFPLLPHRPDWTKNTPTFCNSCTAKNPNTNLLDGNPCTFWVIPSRHNAWTVFDMGRSHTITGIRIWGWDSPQMIRTFELQKSQNVEGPWKSVAFFTCDREGSTKPSDPGVQFYGADSRVFDLLTKHDLQSFGDSIVMKGYNTFEKFVMMQPAALSELIIETDKRQDLVKEMTHFRLLVHPLTQLAWLKTPVTMATEGQAVPELSVQSDPEVTEEVRLVVEGVEVIGDVKSALKPLGTNQPSVATFSNIIFNSVGSAQLKVESVRFPHISVTCPHKIEVRPKAKVDQDVAAAFDELEAMLHEARVSLDKPKEEAFSVPEINWS